MNSNRRQLQVEAEEPGLMETAIAAFKQSNMVGSFLASDDTTSESVLSRDAINPYEGDYLAGYEEHADRFKFVYSEDALAKTKAAIDRETRDREVVDAAGAKGVALSIAAGVLDPINLVPLSTVVRSAKLGDSIIQSAGKTALAGGLSTATAEGVLQSTQLLRTPEESALTITGATLLSGIIGGVGGAAYFRGFHKTAKQLEQDLADDLELNLSVGAASVMGPREGMLTKTALGVKDKDVINLLTMGPGARLEQSKFKSAIETARRLESNPSIQRMNAEGIASPQAVEDFVQMWEANYGQAMLDMDKAFFKFRKGTDTNSVARMKLNDLTAFRGMTKSAFNEQVSIAMRNGDTHAIPEVAEAAKAWRKNFYDPVLKAAIEAKLLPDNFAGVDPITAVSYINRKYDVTKIKNNRQAFTDVITSWLKAGGSRPQEIERAKAHVKEVSARIGKLQELKRLADDAIAGIKNESDIRIQDKTPKTAPPKDDSLRMYERMLQDLKDEIAKAEDLEGWMMKVVSDAIAPQKPKDTSASDAFKAFLKEETQRVKEVLAGVRGDRKKVMSQITASKAALDTVLGRYTDLEKSLVNLKSLDQTELTEIAEGIIENITHFGRMELPGAGASVFHKRAFLIPDNMIQDYLENDVEVLAGSIYHHVIPRIELAKAFGDPSMKGQIEALKEEARALIRANPDQAAKIEKELERDIQDIEAIRDRLLGVYRAPEDPDAFIPRASLVIRQQNFVSMLGQMTLSSISDIGKPMMNAGLRRYGKGLAAIALSPKKFKLAASEAKKAGLAWDMVLHSRAKALYEIGDPYGRLSKIERVSKGMANSYGLVTLMDPWNAMMRQFSSVLIADRILSASEKLVAGKIGKRDLERLAASGISHDTAKRIAAEFGKVGESVTGLRIARTDLWKDKEALKAFRAALVKDVNNTIVMPGKGDSPLWMSSELGKHVTQFQSFSISSVRRTLQTGLQTRDMATLNGVLLMLAAGSASYATKQAFKGEEVDTDNIIMEAIDQSGLFGYLWEVPQMVNRATGDSMWQSSQRYKNRPDITSLMGPTASQGTRVLKIAGKAISDQEFDEKNFRKLVPYQNLFYLRWLFDEAEAGMAD